MALRLSFETGPLRMTPKVRWLEMKFAAGILIKADGSNRGDPLWEYQAVLVKADDAAEAERKAYDFGRRHDHAYVAADGNEVRWRFNAVHKVQLIIPAEEQDVAEVFSLFLRDDEVRSILEPIDGRP